MDNGTQLSNHASASSSPAHAVPIQHDNLTFDNRHVQRIKEMEKFVIDEAKKRKKDWEKDVERMKEEFLHLLPTSPSHKPASSRHSSGGGGYTETIEPLMVESSQDLVDKRRGSLDVLDNKKMKTLFLEYPGSGMRYKLRFDISEFEAASVKVGGLERIVNGVGWS